MMKNLLTKFVSMLTFAERDRQRKRGGRGGVI